MSNWNLSNEKYFPKGDPAHTNRFYGYIEREIELPDGKMATFFGVDVPPTGHIVALEDDLTTYMVRQKRPNLMRPSDTVVPTTLELPGGFLREDMTPEEAVNQELRQEVGLSAGTVMQIGELNAYPGISNERDAVFIGRSLSQVTRADFDDTEQDMEVVAEKFSTLYDSIIGGDRQVSAQTIAAIAKASRYL